MTQPVHLDTFVALDVETANRYRGSICEIGLVRFEGHEVVDRFSSLIRPHADYDEFEYTHVHGISSLDVENAPTLSDAWSDIWGFIGKGPFLAHNASFDVGALFDASGHLRLAIPRTDFYCSLILSRRILGLSGHSLAEVAAHFGIKQVSAHRAEDDALVAGKVASRLIQSTSSVSLAELAEKFSVAPGVLDSDTNVGTKTKTELSDHVTSLPRTIPPSRRGGVTQLEDDGRAIARDQLLDWVNNLPTGLLNPVGSFYSHEVFFHNTGGEFTPWQGQQLVALEGGLSSTKLTKFTSIVVCIPGEDALYHRLGLRVETPSSFLRLSDRTVDDLPDVPKPSRRPGTGAYWFRV